MYSILLLAALTVIICYCCLLFSTLRLGICYVVQLAVTEGVHDTVDTVDPLDLIDPVEILSKLPADFYDKMVILIFVLFLFSMVVSSFACVEIS